MRRCPKKHLSRRKECAHSMTANEHTGVLGPMRGKEWKKSGKKAENNEEVTEAGGEGGAKEHNGDNESDAEFIMTLDKLEPGQAGIILELNTVGGMRRRLMDLGFSAGEHVECVLKSPPGDPRAYLVRGTVTALRGKDAAEITLRVKNRACNMRSAARRNRGAENEEG